MTTLWTSPRQCLQVVNLPSSLRRAYSRSATPGPLRPLRPSSYHHAERLRPHCPTRQHRRQLLTLAIETSCDDTCVAILEKDSTGRARLHFNERRSLDISAYQGIHPLEACSSHNTHLAELIREALPALPKADSAVKGTEGSHRGAAVLPVHGEPRLKPDFVSVTRGPGMAACLVTGLNIAKGLAVAWDVPLLAVHHMQAHALTPRLVGALEKKDGTAEGVADTQSPQFPFLSLLVSGGHTILVSSRSLTEHSIVAESASLALGNMLDQCARMILPGEIISANAKLTMFGPLLEEFAFPGSTEETTQQYGYEYEPPARRCDEIAEFHSEFDWSLTPPLSESGSGKVAASTYNFNGFNGQVQKLMQRKPNMGVDERRVLARTTMRLVFEHLATRVVWALRDTAEYQPKVKTLVLSGGVASNMYLRHVMRAMLDARGYADVETIAPPVSLCTDNAAMIAWTGMEMYEAGYRSALDIPLLRKWPLDHKDEGGGILEVPGWHVVNEQS
ncbi:glycoprotease family-domain-containing protein [Xylariaceae sp. FL0594]|nr:glycoprotease family-domain-containing protein [Xylariaceae sp. FL0594]